MYKKLLIITVAVLGVSMGTKAQSVFIGSHSNSSYFLCPSGILEVWGSNYYGQLGIGSATDSYTPEQVNALSDITEVTGGFGFSLFLKNDGTAWSSGKNDHGQLGDGTTQTKYSPVMVSELTGISALAGGELHSLFQKDDGSVWACGRNNYGQLGDGSTTSSTTPVQVSGLSDIIAVAAGQYHSLFLKSDGSVWACGSNNTGQLGDGTTTNRTTPVQVSGLSDITAIAAGKNHTLFLKSDGSVWACGKNEYGQLGDGSITTAVTPIQVNGLSDITAIAAGLNHSLFLKSDGNVWACGSNYYGEMGNGTTTVLPISTPIQLSAFSDITAIAAGSYHSLWLKNDGSVMASGYNSSGQLGDGTSTNKSTPVQVVTDANCQTVGIANMNNPLSRLSVYPNPATGKIVIETSSSNPAGRKYRVDIFSAFGQMVLQSSPGNWNNDQATVDITSLSSGIYFIRLFDGKNEQQAKFVKE